jgi:acyl-coenzyme A thioesterase PaaI-like protein
VSNGFDLNPDLWSGPLADRQPAETPSRVAMQQLGSAIRALTIALHDADVPASVADHAAETIRVLTESIRESPRRDYAESIHRWSGYADFSPLAGLVNPLAPPMTIEPQTDGTVIASVVFSDAYEGPPGHVHGGMLAAAFDDVLGRAQIIDGKVGMTGKLSVSYRRPTPLNRELRITGRVTSVSGRKVLCEAECRVFHNEEWVVTSHAEGLFISLPDGFRRLESASGSE